MQDKEQTLQQLRKECEDLKKDLGEKDELIADLRKRWVKTANELDRFRANSQGFYQITDEYLIGQISHMRLTIRDFSIQYFDGRSSSSNRLALACPNYSNHLKSISENDYHHYTRSPTDCHKAVQAFIWRVIVDEILGKFEWVGKDYSKHFRQVWRGVLPRTRPDPESPVLPPESETERRLQTWRATTTALLLENIDAEKAESYIKLRAYDHSWKVVNTLRELAESGEERELRAQLMTIFTQAFAMDKEISRQPGLVSWQFHDTRQAKMQEGGDSGLVISPAVIKRGKSTGEAFDHVTTLLEAEMDCRG